MNLFERKRDREPDPYAPPRIRDLSHEPVVMSDGTPVPPRGLPRASSLARELDNTAQDLDDLKSALQQEAPLPGSYPAIYKERKLTDLEGIASWGKYLTYTDMKKFATDVLDGKTPATPAEFADLFEEWCRKVIAAAQTEEGTP